MSFESVMTWTVSYDLVKETLAGDDSVSSFEGAFMLFDEATTTKTYLTCLYKDSFHARTMQDNE